MCVCVCVCVCVLYEHIMCAQMRMPSGVPHSPTFCLIALRQGLSLNLEVDRWLDPLVLSLLSASPITVVTTVSWTMPVFHVDSVI